MSRSECPHHAAWRGIVAGVHDADVGRAPICPYCGVTALPADLSHVIDVGFVCENPDCEAFGEAVAEGGGA